MEGRRGSADEAAIELSVSTRLHMSRSEVTSSNCSMAPTSRADEAAIDTDMATIC